MDEERITHWSGDYLAARQIGRWEYVSRVRDIGAAALLALDTGSDGVVHVILVEQYRAAHGAPSLEFPAGLVGDIEADETPMEAAAKELEEETGYRAGRLENLGRFCSSPGMTNETFTLVRATALEKVGPGGGTESEDIIVHRIPLDAVAEFVANQRSRGCVIDVRVMSLLAADWIAEVIQ